MLKLQKYPPSPNPPTKTVLLEVRLASAAFELEYILLKYLNDNFYYIQKLIINVFFREH